MNISEKAAYLKGLAEGMELDGKSKEGKLFNKVIELIGDIAQAVDEIDADVDELYDFAGELDEDLGDVEKLLYDDEDDECDCGCEDDEVYDLECPSCGEKITIDSDTLEEGGMKCPKCGEELEFDLSESDDEEEDEDE